jgi:O-glycosyl hydrolase
MIIIALVSPRVSMETAASTVTVSINKDSIYQTIDGFGAHGSMRVWWVDGPFYDDAFLSWIVDSMGLTICRNEYYPPTDEQCNFAKQAPFLKALKTKATASNEPMKFMASIWSPPANWKSNNSLINGGNLLPSHYIDFGHYLVDSVIRSYKKTSVSIYTASVHRMSRVRRPATTVATTRPRPILTCSEW